MTTAAFRTKLVIVDGDETWAVVPKIAKDASLLRRTALIQETWPAPEGWDGMYYDEGVCFSLIDLAERFGAVRVFEPAPPYARWSFGGLNPFVRRAFASDLSPAQWMAAQARLAPDDRGPWELLTALPGLVIAAEPWANAGGPWPYHDSYTYALYADRSLAADLRAHLMADPRAGGWALAAKDLPGGNPLRG